MTISLRRFAILAAAVAPLALAACGETGRERAATGALTGAAVGAVITGPVGALAGAGIGGAAGVIMNEGVDTKLKEAKDSMMQQ